jgi:hypothetical protein
MDKIIKISLPSELRIKGKICTFFYTMLALCFNSIMTAILA